MLLLLPPSEAKSPGGAGPALSALLDPADPMTEARLSCARALGELVAGPADAAAQALLLPAAARDEALAANAAVLDSPTMPALQRYAGVVYGGLRAQELPPKARAAAAERIIIFSGLLGAMRGGDPAPWYRLPAKGVLPGLGVASTFWRPRLAPMMAALLAGAPDELVADLRSSDYAAMWRPEAAQRARVVSVRVLTERADGARAVISFDSKFAKGRLAAALMRRQSRVRRPLTTSDIAAAWSGIEPDGRAELRVEGGATAVDLIRPSTVGR